MSQEGSGYSPQSQDRNNNNVSDSSAEGTLLNNAQPQQSRDLPQPQVLRNVNDENANTLQDTTPPSELQRRRTEALERILLASDSNLSLPPPSPSPSSPGSVNRHLRLAGPRRVRGSQRCYLNRNTQQRNDSMERAIFIPFRARSSMSALNLPTTTQTQDNSRAMRNALGNSGRGLGVTGDMNGNHRRDESNGNWSNRPRLNVSTFFMELTYSTAEPHLGGFNPFRSSSEGQKRKLEIHSANTMAFIKQYCPVKLHKLSQFRCCIKTQKPDFFNFKNMDVNPLDSMDFTQVKCNTKVIAIVKDELSGPGKSFNHFTSHLLTYLRKKSLNPTCLTFQSDACLLNYIEHLNSQLHAFPKKSNNMHDLKFTKQAKSFLVMSTISRLVERWNVPILILDSSVSKIIDVNSVIDFAKRFQIKLFNVDADISNPSGGTSKERKAGAKKLARKIKKAMIERNIMKIKNDLEKISSHLQSGLVKDCKSGMDYYSPTLISDDCRRIVFNLHERMSHSLQQQQGLNVPESKDSLMTEPPKISLLEDGILADIENSAAFKYQQHQHKGDRDVLTPKSTSCNSGRKCVSRGTTTSTTSADNKEGRPRTGYSISDDEIQFPTRDTEKVSELLFNELNQRWRVHGPQRFISRGTDAGPYCDPLLDSEKQLLLSVIQEVANFEVLKDIRNELKDSKKDLEGRLYGYNPDFANLIASAEEFLHGKASCLEPCQEEMDFYKMPVSLVYSEAEVKYMKMKPPLYLLGSESPSQVMRAAMEESTKLFLDAVLHTACGARQLPSSCRHKTKAIVVIEDNNEVLELLTVALWFFEKTPLATFQAKFCHNTPEFLLSLDACRCYFGTYPVSSTKKDDEHLFERWLGVGMNGILRSLQSKILLIDFPRPGTNLQNSKNILFNRLKIEEKLHNIKSFSVGKPSRKEDNLSSVENILDEIQKCLDPRDKLLFRKARRMYLDLKLYKQIEQKSRQDLKSMRDWGIVEPDAENEHELWERLRNSEIIKNNISASTPDLTSITSENLEITSSHHDSEFNALSEEDLSETHSTHSRDVGYEYQSCEEDEEASSLLRVRSGGTHEDEEVAVLSYLSNSHRNIAVNTDSTEGRNGGCNEVKDGRLSDSGVDGDHDDLTLTSTFEDGIVKTISEQTSSETVPEFSHPHVETHINMEKLSQQLESESELRESFSGITAPEIVSHESPKEPENACVASPIKRSAGFFNIFDGKSVCEQLKTNFKRRIYSRSEALNEDSMDDNMNSQKYTRLEFTLPPKVTSEESFTQSNSSLPIKTLDGEGKSNLTFDFNNEMRANRGKKVKLPSKSKSFHEYCKAYLHKWGKSVSQILRKPKPRRIFPERLIHATLHKTENGSTGKASSLQLASARQDSQSTRLSIPEKNEIAPPSSHSDHKINPRWLHSLTRIFKRNDNKKTSKT